MAIQFTKADDFTKRTSEELKSIVMNEDVTIKFKLRKVLADRGMTMADLAKESGINYRYIHNYATEYFSSTLNLEHLLAMIIVLRITDISELLSIEIPEETKLRFEKDKELWKKNNWRPVYRRGQQDS